MRPCAQRGRLRPPAPILGGTQLRTEPSLTDARTAATPLSGDAARPIVVALCQALAREGILYCHFKSNDMLHKTETAENDLDLLVHRGDVDGFIAVLTGMGFKQADGPPSRRIPSVTHYYGLDDSGLLVNVHAHFQLVAGDDTTKNYRVPFEEAYLGSVTQRGIFPVPDAALELILFVIRMVLKHGAPDVIPFGKAKLNKAERDELADLLTKTTPTDAARLVDEHLAVVGSALWLRCLRSLEPGRGAARVRAALALQRRLAPFGRRPMLTDTAYKVTRRGLWGAKRFLLRRKTRKTLAAGGSVIAFVGGDGAGKSTVVESTERWLRQTFETRRVHLGKPPRSLLTILVKGTLLVGVKLGALPGLREEVRAAAGDERSDLGALWALWHLMTARDRARTFGRARRFANNGGIVICDRFPLPWIRLMDGRRGARAAAAPGAGGLTKLLGRLEARYYDKLGMPDVLIVLRLDPEIAVERKRGVDESTYVRARNTEIYGAAWDQTPALVVDASQEADEVARTVRSLVWERL